MDCLYSITIQYSYKEYRRFNWKLFLNPIRVIIYIALELWLLFLGWLVGHHFLYLLAILCPVLMVISQDIQFKKTWLSNKIAKNQTVKFDFYDTYFIGKDSYGESKVEYKKLYKILETKTDFYLMLSKNQGSILVKANLPDGLCEFLRTIKIS